MKKPSRSNKENSPWLNALLVIIVIAAVAGSYWYFFQHRIGNDTGNLPTAETGLKVLSAEEYRVEVKAALKDYDAALSGTADTTAIVSRRDHLLGLTIPKEYKDAHLKLVMAGDALAARDLEQAKSLLKELLAAYPELKD